MIYTVEEQLHVWHTKQTPCASRLMWSRSKVNNDDKTSTDDRHHSWIEQNWVRTEWFLLCSRCSRRLQSKRTQYTMPDYAFCSLRLPRRADVNENVRTWGSTLKTLKLFCMSRAMFEQKCHCKKDLAHHWIRFKKKQANSKRCYACLIKLNGGPLPKQRLSALRWPQEELSVTGTLLSFK